MAYVNKALGPKNRGMLVYEKEYMAILLAAEQWRPYLQMQHFAIKTDQKSLVHLQSQKFITAWQQKALTKLMGLDYQIAYKKGTENSAADALSRRPPEKQLFSVSKVQPVWMAEISDSYNGDKTATELFQQLALDPTSKPNHQLLQGIIRYKGAIWIGNKLDLHNKIFAAFHDSPVGGHSGFPVTYRRIHSLFRSSGMKKFIREKSNHVSLASKLSQKGLITPGCCPHC